MPDPIDHLQIRPADLQGIVGEALFAGSLRATMRSKLTDQHVTLRFHAKSKVADRWHELPWSVASHVFVDAGSGYDKVGAYYPTTSSARWAGWLYPDGTADPARVWAARKVLLIAAGRAELETDQYELVLGTHCLRCGRELDEPESVAAGMGPYCREVVSKEYGTRHQQRQFAVQSSSFGLQPGESIEHFVARLQAEVGA